MCFVCVKIKEEEEEGKRVSPSIPPSSIGRDNSCTENTVFCHEAVMEKRKERGGKFNSASETLRNIQDFRVLF